MVIEDNQTYLIQKEVDFLFVINLSLEQKEG